MYILAEGQWGEGELNITDFSHPVAVLLRGKSCTLEPFPPFLQVALGLAPTPHCQRHPLTCPVDSPLQSNNTEQGTPVDLHDLLSDSWKIKQK